MGVVLVDNRCVMSEYQKDRQGVLRGKCNECSCPLYRSAKGLACTCLHLPVKHEKIGDKRSLPGSYSGAGSPTASHVAVGFSGETTILPFVQTLYNSKSVVDHVLVPTIYNVTPV